MPQDATSAEVVGKEISIHDQTFQVSAPYAEGHTLTAIEAKVLNQVRAENVANNFRKRVKAAVEGTPMKEGGEVESLDAVKAAFAEYDSKYTFAMPGSGARSEPIDPVEREARKIARQAIKDALAAQGRKLKEIDEDTLEAAIDRAAEQEDIVKEAKRRVKSQKAAADATLASLGL